MKQQRFSSYEQSQSKKRTKREVFLTEMDQVVPWARLEALIARSVFYDLVELGVVENDKFGVWSHGVFFPITDADELEAL